MPWHWRCGQPIRLRPCRPLPPRPPVGCHLPSTRPPWLNRPASWPCARWSSGWASLTVLHLIRPWPGRMQACQRSLTWWSIWWHPPSGAATPCCTSALASRALCAKAAGARCVPWVMPARPRPLRKTATPCSCCSPWGRKPMATVCPPCCARWMARWASWRWAWPPAPAGCSMRQRGARWTVRWPWDLPVPWPGSGWKTPPTPTTRPGCCRPGWRAQTPSSCATHHRCTWTWLPVCVAWSRRPAWPHMTCRCC